MTQNDGGPAFPQMDPGSAYGNAEGMTLRDWFAGQALAGILANPDISASAARCMVSTDEFRSDVAKSAYQLADAMLEARKK